MEQKQQRQLETELLRMGLAGLHANGNPTLELVGQLAAIVNNWQTSPNRHGEWIDRHKFLRDLLAECDKQYRNEMYEAIVPHLKFKAHPLSQYETMMTERIAGLVSKGAARTEGRAPAPIEVGGKKYTGATRDLATHALATLHCQRCFKKKRFLADTPAGAMIAARKAGWQRIFDKDTLAKETCPVCVKKIAAERVN